jgi:hypothetical protein
VPRLPPHPRLQPQQAANDRWQEPPPEEEQQTPPPRHTEDEGWDETLDVPNVPLRATHELKRRAAAAASSPELSSGPAAPDPYAGDEGSSLLVPLLVALGLFLPAVLLLCRL